MKRARVEPEARRGTPSARAVRAITKLSLEHLSGTRRGQIDTLETTPATIGSEPGVQILVPEAAWRHARILLDGDHVVLQDAGSGRETLLASEAVRQVVLRDGDVVELGSGGPRLRFRREGEVRASALPRLYEHADFRIALALVLLAGTVLVGWTYRLNRQVERLQHALHVAEAERQRFQERIEEERRKAETNRESLEGRIDESRRHQEELRQRLAEAADGSDVRVLREELLTTRSRLVALEGEREAAEVIIRSYGAGVCLIQGSYAFYDAEGRPLRYRVDEAGERVREADGSLAVDVEGNGPNYTVDYVGTGFLVDRGGIILTNRHVAEPWWKDDAAESLAKDGYRPRFLVFRAFFPRVAEGLRLDVHRRSETLDLALLKVDVKGRKIPTLPLDVSRQGAVAGQPVVVVGYPTGLDALLAKTDAGVVQEILTAHGTSTGRITEALSRKGLIRPSTTQGHIGDVTKTDIVFDAATTQGGSGGPVFNRNGRVIAVEYALLPKFAGSSYGLPVRYALELLKEPRT
jgi:S1-C subfamily serine protease